MPQIQHLALMAWAFVRWTGWPGAIGLAGFVLAAGFTQSIWFGAAIGLVAGIVAHVLMTEQTTAS